MIVASIECAKGIAKTPVGVVQGGGGGGGQGARKVGWNKYEYADMNVFRELIRLQRVEDGPSLQVVDRIMNPPQKNPLLTKFIPANSFTPETKDLPYPLQLEAIHQIIEVHNGRAVLEAPPGAGKTAIALPVIRHFGGSCLVVCPASVRSHWKNDGKKWVGIDFTLISGCKKVYDPLPKRVVVSYDTLRVNKQLLGKKRWNVVIIDESHLIKNPKAKKTIAVLSVLEKAEHFILMSGTPMKKCPSELYCQLLPCLGASVLRSYDEFAQRYCSAKYELVASSGGPFWKRKKGGGGKQQLVMGMARYKQELNLLMDTCCVRVPVNMEEMLPPFKRFIEPIALSMDDLLEQHDLQAKLAAATTKEDADMLVMELWRLSCKQKAPHHSRLINESLALNPEKGRLIVFNQLRATADHIIDNLPIGTSYVRIDARTSEKNRALIIAMLADAENSFNIDVGFLSIGTCALGINLTPRRNNCYMTDLPFSVQDVVQCENKLRRLGAKLPITSIWGVAEGSHDDNFMASLKRKLNTCSEVVQGKKQLLEFDLPDQLEEEEEEERPKKKKKRTLDPFMEGGGLHNKQQKTLDQYWIL